MLPKKQIKSPFSSSSNNSNSFKNKIYNQDYNNSEKQLPELNLNSSSNFIKSTLTTIPKSSYLKKQLKIPFGINITPLNNNEDINDINSIPLIDYGESYELPHCQNPKCKAFINPYIELINDGEQWKCNICKSINKTKEYLYNSLEDFKVKPELNCGTYDFISYKDNFIKNRPNLIFTSYFFLIDISQTAINSGFTQCVLETLKEILNNNTNNKNNDFNLCILTFDELIHFYPIDINYDNKNNINMLSINENFKNLFLPIKKDFLLVNFKKYKNKFIQIIESIQNFTLDENYNAPKEATRFFDAIKICDLIGEKTGGKIFIFSGSNLSKLDFMNNIKKDNNDDFKSQKYKTTDGGKIGQFGISISLHGLSVNIFQANKLYTNIRTLNQLIINTNGNFYFYKNFSPPKHYKSLFNQVIKTFQNETVFEGGLKFFFSHKFGIKDYLTPCLIYNKEIIYFPNLDSDQSFSFILEMNYNNDYESSENYTINEDYFFMQINYLFNKGNGKKIIRVFNYRFNVTNNPRDIYDSINAENLSVICLQKLITDLYRNKNIIESLNKFENKFKEIYQGYFNNLNKIMKELNDEMKFFSLYILGILKNCLFNKNDKGMNNDVDLTNFFLCKIQKLKIEEILCFIYPRIYALNETLNNENSFPQVINTNLESLLSNGNIFLIDNGFNLILYIIY